VIFLFSQHDDSTDESRLQQSSSSLRNSFGSKG
jgi:hypothetical protein